MMQNDQNFQVEQNKSQHSIYSARDQPSNHGNRKVEN